METEKTVLLNVGIQAKEALKELAELRIKSDELKSAQKQLDKTTTDGRVQYEALGQQIKAVNSAANDRQKTIQNEIKAQNQQEGSIQKLKAELSLMTAQYNNLSGAEAKSGKQGAFLAAAIADTSKQLSEAEQELGNYHRQVGDYEVATKGLKTEMRELTESLVGMKLAGQEGTAEYQAMSDKLATLKDAMGDVNQQTQALASDTKGLDTLTSSISTLTAGFAIYTSAVGAATGDNEEMQKAMKNLQVAAVALSAAITIQNNLQKQSILYQQAQVLLQKIGINQTLRAAAAEAAYTKMKAAGTIGSKIAAAATWLWNAALAANPVVLVAMAVAALIAGLYLLSKAFDFSSSESKSATKASENYEKQAAKTANAVDAANAKMNNATSRRKQALSDEIIALIKSGATSEEIAKAKEKAENDMRDIAVAASKEREAAMRKEWDASQKNVDAQKALLNSLEVGSDKYKEQLVVVNDLIKAKNELAGSINTEIESQKQAAVDSAEAGRKAADDNKKAAAEQVKANMEKANKLLESQKKLQDELAKERQLAVKKDFASQTAWNAEEFARNQAHEKAKLDLQKKTGQITAAEFNEQNKLLQIQAATFQGQQLIDVTEQYASRFKAIKDQLKKNEQEEKQATREKYDSDINELRAHTKVLNEEYEQLARQTQTAAMGDISGLGALTEKDRARFTELQKMAFENAQVISALEKQKAEEIETINRNSMVAQIADVEKALSGQYDTDLAKYSDNAKAKLAIESEMTKKRIEELKKLAAAEPDPKLKSEIQKKIYEEEASLRAKETQARLTSMNAELSNSMNTAKDKLNIKKKYLEAELEAVKGNAEKENEVLSQLAESRSEYLKSTIDNVANWAGAAMTVISGINEIKTNKENEEMAQYEADSERKAEILQEQLDNGLITQESYDGKIQKLEQEKATKQRKLAYDQAKRQKEMAIMNATIQAGLAIASSLAQSPVAIGPIPNPAGIASLALATVMGGLAIGTAISTPLPKASRGMLLRGPSHASGGIPIEAEGGEAIINRRSTQMFKPLLSALNEAGGGVKFAAGGIPVAMKYDGGYQQRFEEKNNQAITRDEMNAMIQAIKELKIYVAMSDIQRGLANYAQINDNNPNY